MNTLKTSKESLFGMRNLVLFVLGFALLLVGYICLGQGPAENPLSKTVAPILLVIAYCIIFPLAIIMGPRKK